MKMMRKVTVSVTLAVALAGCGGGAVQHVPSDRGTASAALHAPPMPSSLTSAPALPAFARPTFPAELSRIKTPALTQRNVEASRAAQSAAKAPAGRSAGFFANEQYLGSDANGFAAYYLPSFGYYTYASPTPGVHPFPGWFYKYGFGWVYDLGSSSPGANDAYFYDLALGFFYTAPGFGSDANYMYFYHFATGHFMVYFQSFSLPRYFYDYNGHLFFSKIVVGDMLNFAPNRGWNYQSALGGGITLSTYVNPSLLNDGSMVWAASAESGSLATVLTDHTTAELNAVGGLSMREYSDGYHVIGEVSAGSSALIPGQPLLMPSALIEGEVFSPYPGVTVTVLNVGPTAGETGCGGSVSATGAKLRYDIVGNGTWYLSVVPYCGITFLVSPSNAIFSLASYGTYNIGDLGKARRVESASVGTTILSILGRGKQEFPAAKLFK